MQMNRMPIDKPLQYIPVYFTKMGNYQASVYEFIMEYLQSRSTQTTNRFGKVREMPDFENMERFGYTLLQQPIESLNIAFPNKEFDSITSTNIDENQRIAIIKKCIGKQGLAEIMTYEMQSNPDSSEKTRTKFQYKPAILSSYGRIFHPENLPKYSAKITKICDAIRNSKGIVLVYSQFIDGGVVPIALALEEMGFSRYGKTKSLFKNPPTTDLLDAVTMKPRSQLSDSNAFAPAQYVMITGDKSLSPNNAQDMKYVTRAENKYGEKVKVILITKAGSEGLDFKNIRQVHIMEPWYNMSRIDQIVGRAVRNFSHCKLPFEERNVQIFLHASLPKNDEEPADLYVYRFAEKKSVQIGKVTRVLKQIAVDCVLHIRQTDFTLDKLAQLPENQNIEMTLSAMSLEGEPKKIKYQIGDRPNTDVCDYMDCNFTCSPNAAPSTQPVIQTTYNDTFLKTNYGSIVKRIRQLFRVQAFYKRAQLIEQINATKKYPVEQIDFALTRVLTSTDEYLVDKYGRSGRLINRGEYYAFQPQEMTDEHASILERTVPVDFKRTHLELELMPAVARHSVSLMAPPESVRKQKSVETMVEEPENVQTEHLEEMYRQLMGVLATNIQNGLITPNAKDIKAKEGQLDWYKCLAKVLILIREMHHIPDNYIQKYTIYHFLDCLPLTDRMHLLQYFYRDVDAEEMTPTIPSPMIPVERIVREYFEERRLSPFVKVFLFAVSANKIKLVLHENKTKWTEVPEEEYETYKEELRTFLVNAKKYNDLIGFMTLFKEGEMVFKNKNLNDKRNNKGVYCVKSGRPDIFKRLNQIQTDIIYDETTIDQKKTGIFKNELCIILEMLLRYYQDTSKENRIWFLDPERATMNDFVDFVRK